MAKAREGRTDIAVAIVALAAEAAELETRVTALRKELVDVDRHMTAVSAALDRLSPA
ncbi:hypothetical protein ACFWDQ_01675 [Streptomyces sp. NPDC060053]|uniref:hypothetical protein n=1 Tax=Streptomyces sp. NPDC060053 TaxID=3347047 RepID=UPI0036A0F256